MSAFISARRGRRITRWLRAITAIALLLGAPRIDSAAAASDAEGDLVAWAYGRFATAGLDLPGDLTVEFHRTTDECGRHLGRYLPAERRVVVCQTDDDPELELHHREHVLLHELAHAWVDVGVTDERRRDFMRDRAASSWNDPSDDWHERASEQAAEILAWGLLDREPGFLNIHDTACERLHTAYRLLTDTDPVNATVTCS